MICRVISQVSVIDRIMVKIMDFDNVLTIKIVKNVSINIVTEVIADARSDVL